MMYKNIKYIIYKISVLLIIFLSIIISFKKNYTFKKWFINKVLNHNIPFYAIKKEYLKLFGTILPFDNYEEYIPVFNEKIEYSNLNVLDDKIELIVTNNYVVPSITSGIVTFVGEKDGFKSILIESDEVNILYLNINSNLKLYDEVLLGNIIGEVINDKLYLEFKKDDKIVDYKKYI